MEEQLISFETAKLAKEKGFNEPCSYKYTPGGTTTYNTNRRDMDIYAPTQSLLQKWLREIHSIDIMIEPNQDSDGNKYYCWRGRKNMFPSTIGNVANHYEEALEDGLIEALKLIHNESKR